MTVVRRARRYGGEEPPPLPPLPNVRYETDYVPDERLRQLQNECEVHVIPSQAEGYGHVIGEAMACGAVVVTTDAPPMNELVRPDRGMLIRVARSEPMRRSTRNFIDVGDLEAKLNQVFAMSPERRAELGRNARRGTKPRTCASETWRRSCRAPWTGLKPKAGGQRPEAWSLPCAPARELVLRDVMRQPLRHDPMPGRRPVRVVVEVQGLRPLVLLEDWQGLEQVDPEGGGALADGPLSEVGCPLSLFMKA